MATEDLFIRLGLKGQSQVARGLRDVKASTKEVGDAASTAGAKAQMMGAKFSQAGNQATVSMRHLIGAVGLFAGAQGIGRLAVAGVKWGLSFNSQVEQARLRFQLFTSDVNGLTDSVKAIDKASTFNFADLADAAALLGGSGIKDVPKTLQAAANAAAGGGKGTEGLKSIVLALSQIQSKGRLSQEEVNQLTEGGAITAQRDLSKGLHLTAKELQNLGGQGIEAKKALDVLTKAWTTGKMADAAERQLGSLQGQWDLFTGDMQKLSGLATLGLTASLEKDVIPAAHRATEAISAIFEDKGLSNEEKMRRARVVIRRELGPIGDDLKDKLDKAHIPEHLGDLVGEAIPFMTDQAAKAAPHVAKAFVDGWLHSGPWAQIAALLFIGKKGVDVRRWAGGGKGGKAGVATLLGARGASPVNPVWVREVGKHDSIVKDVIRKAAVPAADTAAALGGAAGLGSLAVGGGMASLLGVVAYKNRKNDFPSRAADGTVARQAAGTIPAPGFGGGMPGALALTTNVQIEGRNVATAISTTNARLGARK